ncbi:MAG: holo-ACP synthase [Sphaerochaeta sp.]|jgi:holo-[acyl-carrier protein] synthase|nr:holo-ACP synthase [Sphaerochaeta sp.]
MIEGIGIDVVNIDRMAKLSSGALSRLFHSDELATALSISSGVSSARNQYLAGRYAAKEALGKALGCGLLGLSPVDINTANDANGRPYITVYGEVKHLVGEKKILLSISHDNPVAIAVVLLQDGSDGPQ